MNWLELFAIAVGLSMDAFAVAIGNGLCLHGIRYKPALITGLFFGGFQAFMPLIGFYLGSRFEAYLNSVDHWIIFILLATIGINMILESRNKQVKKDCEAFRMKNMTLMSLATSIDALAVGVTFAFLHADIYISVAVIGLTTFALAFTGVLIGSMFGMRFKAKAEIAGGVLLILIGLKILLEHLGYLPVS